MRRRLPLVAAAAGATTSALLLAGCGLGADGPATRTPAPASRSASVSPTPTATASALPDGVLAVVDATARREGGAELGLRMTVRAVAVLPAPAAPGGGSPDASSSGFGVVADGAATQIAVLGADPEPGDAVPHCAQPAVLTGAGSGEVDIAAPDAAPPAWASLAFGFGVAPTTDGSAPLPLRFTSCTVAGTSRSGVDWVRSTTAGGAAACAIQAT